MNNIKFNWEKDTSEDNSEFGKQEIIEIANSAEALYKTVFLTAASKKREINIPEENLAKLQKLVLTHYLKETEVHPKVFSYVSDSTLHCHASLHKEYNFTLKVDLNNFFESLKENVVLQYFSTVTSFETAEILTKITCKSGSLPLGSCSSPMLSNLILKKLDEFWDSYAKSNQALYTRYSDDIYISSNNQDFLLELLPRFESYIDDFFPYLKINKTKSGLLKGNNRKITGLVITQDDRITVGRKRKRELRVLLDHFKKNALTKTQVSSLRGKLLFLQGHDYDFFSSLSTKFSDEIAMIYAWADTPPSPVNPESPAIKSPNKSKTFPSPNVTFNIQSNITASENSRQMIKTYFDLGWKLLPCFPINGLHCACNNPECKSPGKHPCVKHGVYDATENFDEFLPWLEKGANIAVATGFPSKIVVLDIDPNKGGIDSYKQLHNFIDAKLLDTLKCNTGSGGQHLYFLHPEEPLKNRNGILPGIDFRTDGGYVILPPSNHLSGNFYQWEGVEKLNLNLIKPLPESLLEVLKK